MQDETVIQSESSENTSENTEKKTESVNEESFAIDPVLEKNENLLFTIEDQNNTENLSQHNSLNEINKIRDNTGGSFNKGWIDNNPFIQT